MTSITDIVDLISRGGMPVVFVLILYGGYKGVWVWGKDYRELKADRDEWKHHAMYDSNVADTVTEYALRTRDQRDAAGARTRRRRIAEEATSVPLARRRRVEP